MAAWHDIFKPSKQATSGDVRKNQAVEQSMPARLNNVVIKNKYTRCYPLSTYPQRMWRSEEHTSPPIPPNMHLIFVPKIFHTQKTVLLKMQACIWIQL